MNKPADDEIEISIFGTGTGECVAIHVGTGNWILIDSCYLSKNKVPLNVAYLKNLGYDLRDSIKLIICTHWHDDHTKGLSDIFDIIDSPIVVSMALQKMEFLKLASLYQELKVQSNFSSGVDELSKIFELKKKNNSKQILFAINNKKVFVKVSEGNHAIVEFLSPSDEDVLEAVENFADLIPLDKAPIKPVPPVNNKSCIATLIKVANDTLLCGSDKENSLSETSGWQLIYNNFTNQRFQKSSVFKISHHGSENGDHECIWRGMLNENPFAILTPFFKSSLPRKTDIERIKSRTKNAYSTGPEKQTKSNLSPEVKKILRDFNMDKKIHQLNLSFGQIILRKKMTELTWSISTEGAAFKL